MKFAYFPLHIFFTSGTDIWVQEVRWKVKLSGNILIKSHIAKSKFDNVFDIRKSHRLYIHNVRKIHLLFFSVQQLWGKSLKISSSVSIDPIGGEVWVGGGHATQSCIGWKGFLKFPIISMKTHFPCTQYQK